MYGRDFAKWKFFKILELNLVITNSIGNSSYLQQKSVCKIIEILEVQNVRGKFEV
jgi:hypothetical protein